MLERPHTVPGGQAPTPFSSWACPRTKGANVLFQVSVLLLALDSKGYKHTHSKPVVHGTLLSFQVRYWVTVRGSPSHASPLAEWASRFSAVRSAESVRVLHCSLARSRHPSHNVPSSARRGSADFLDLHLVICVRGSSDERKRARHRAAKAGRRLCRRSITA